MRKLIKITDKWLGIIARPFEYAAMILLVVMLLINGVNIFTRSVFNYSHEGVWPWTMTLFVWWVFIGFFPLYRERKDVSIYVVVRYLPAGLNRGLGFFVHLLIAFLTIIMLLTMKRFMGLQAGIIEIVGIPRFWLSAPLVAALFFVGLNALVQCVGIAIGTKPFQAFGEVEI